MIYDFIPDVLLPKVVNRNEFLGAMVFDKWTANVDMRQAIFRRSEKPRGYLASMIDQGHAFGGPQWKFLDSPLYGLYFRTSMYENAESWDDFQPWLNRVVRFPRDVLDQARSEVPPEWILGEEALLDSLLEKLLCRCKRVPDLIDDLLHADVNPFLGGLRRHAACAVGGMNFIAAARLFISAVLRRSRGMPRQCGRKLCFVGEVEPEGRDGDVTVLDGPAVGPFLGRL